MLPVVEIVRTDVVEFDPAKVTLTGLNETLRALVCNEALMAYTLALRWTVSVKPL